MSADSLVQSPWATRQSFFTQKSGLYKYISPQWIDFNETGYNKILMWKRITQMYIANTKEETMFPQKSSVFEQSFVYWIQFKHQSTFKVLQ